MLKNPIEVQHLTSKDFGDTPFEKVILPLKTLDVLAAHLGKE